MTGISFVTSACLCRLRMTFGDSGARINKANPIAKYNTDGNMIINHEELNFMIRSLKSVSEMVNNKAMDAATKRLVRNSEFISVSSTYLLKS